MRFTLSLFLYVLSQQICFAQKASDFISPVKFPIALSASFAELRTNHFHSGIDIKTQGRIGKPIYSIADGYVSRLKISPYGYGRALYITHPNGTTSVYGHLHRYSKIITSYITRKQYEFKESELDINLLPAELPVKQGELVAYSGNTGGSFGPHLHFEIRDAITERPLNPLLYGIQVKDSKPPVFFKLAVYNVVNQNNKRLFVKDVLAQGNNNYTLSSNPLHVPRNFGIGVSVHDYFDLSANKCGVYELKMFLDSELVQYVRFDDFSFSETRNINSFVDFDYKRRSGGWIQKCFTEPGNKLSVYEKNNYGINISDDKVHEILVVAIDSYKNMSTLKFNIIANLPNDKELQNHKLMRFTNENYLVSDSAQVFMGANSFYHDLFVDVKKLRTRNNKNKFAPVYQIGSEYIPLKNKIDVYIRPTNINEKSSKMMIACFDKNGKKKLYKTSVENGYLTAKTDRLGKYTVVIDTVPPQIKLRSQLSVNKRYSGSEIKFYVNDTQSGVVKYQAFIDKQWVLLEYDVKNKKMVYTFDDYINWKAGKHEFILEAEDQTGNKASFNIEFYR